MNPPLHILYFIGGAIMSACLVVALLFARSYRNTGDKFFRQFSLAFALLAVERIVLVGMGRGPFETYPAVYLIRCSAFLIIIYAVVQKNRRVRRE